MMLLRCRPAGILCMLSAALAGMSLARAQAPAPQPPAARFSAAQAQPQAPAGQARPAQPAPVSPAPARPIAAQPAAPPQAQQVQAVNIAMEDQNRVAHDTASLRGDVVVLLYADRNGAEAAHEIGKRLHVHFHPGAAKVDGPDWIRQPVIGIAGWPAGARTPNVHAVAVACLPEIPRAVHPVVRTRIRQESPHVPVWLDFTGTMPRSFGMQPDVPNILLIDTQGRPQGVLSGEIDEAKYQQLVSVIERLRQQAQPVRTASAVEPAAPAR